MSAGRTTMIGGGSGLIALGSLALLARYLEMGGLSAVALGTARGLFHTLTVGTVLSGLILVIFAPPSRRAENRVRLDLAVPLAPTSRPPRSGKAAPVVTNGDPRPPAAPPPAPPPARSVGSSAVTSPPAHGAVSAPAATIPLPRPHDPIATRPPGTNGSGAHPNDAGQDGPQDPREALLARLDELNRRANEIKVRYGLGKVSPGGYRRFIEELDVERSQIEARLMEPEM